MENTKFEIKTQVIDNAIIEQETLSIVHDYKEQVVRQLFDTREKQIREALIKLGWTPPKENEDGKQSQ